MEADIGIVISITNEGVEVDIDGATYVFKAPIDNVGFSIGESSEEGVFVTPESIIEAFIPFKE